MRTCYGPEIIIQENCHIVKIMGKIKLRMMKFGYVTTVHVTIMHTNFQNKLWVLFKVTVQHCSYLSK